LILGSSGPEQYEVRHGLGEIIKPKWIVDTDDDIVSVHEDPRRVADGPDVRGLNRFQASTPRLPGLVSRAISPATTIATQCCRTNA
jgi:hypothetical protein